MSVLFVILGFVLICLILVHINLHQKKRNFYLFIEQVDKTLMTRHKKISKLLKVVQEDEISAEIFKMNKEAIEKIEAGELSPSQRVREEILIEEKMQNFIATLEGQTLSEDIIEAIESYKKTQKKIERNKITYNKMIAEFLDACNIKPANWYASFEHIDMDFPVLKN